MGCAFRVHVLNRRSHVPISEYYAAFSVCIVEVCHVIVVILYLIGACCVNGLFCMSLSSLVDSLVLSLQPDTRWLHRGVKSLSQAEQILRKEHRDGAFFVYRTQSEYAPYIVAYR